ncbi:MAG: hypothetical protein V3W34_04410 [Phycisphaerae bacterium]
MFCQTEARLKPAPAVACRSSPPAEAGGKYRPAEAGQDFEQAASDQRIYEE